MIVAPPDQHLVLIFIITKSSSCHYANVKAIYSSRRRRNTPHGNSMGNSSMTQGSDRSAKTGLIR